MGLLFTVVGMKYHGNYKFTQGERVTLVPEDDNTHDSNAVKVLVENRHVAYVAREHTWVVRRLLRINKFHDEESEIRFDKYASDGSCAVFIFEMSKDEWDIICPPSKRVGIDDPGAFTCKVVAAAKMVGNDW